MDKLLATCGFSIETSSEDVIKQNAAEKGVTDLDWDKVSEDVQVIESAMLKWLDTMFGSARDEGHGSDDSLIGTLFVYRNLDVVKDSLDIGEPLRTSSGTLQLPEMNLTYPELIDISIDFYDLVEEKASVTAGKMAKEWSVFTNDEARRKLGYVVTSEFAPESLALEQAKIKFGKVYSGDIVVEPNNIIDLSYPTDASKKVVSYKQTGTYNDKELLLTDHKAVLRDMVDSDGAYPTNRVLPDDSSMEYSESAVLEGVPIEIFYVLTEEDQKTALETGDEGQIDWLNRIDKIKVDLYNCDRRGTTSDQIDAVVAKYSSGSSKKEGFDVESIRRNASAWTKEQAAAVANLDADFEEFLEAEGIDPNSKEASDAWRTGYQDRMKKIFASKGVASSRNIPQKGSPDWHEHKIAVDTVKNPAKAFLGGPSYRESVEVLKEKFGYSDEDIAKLERGKEVTSAKEMGVEVIVDDDQEPNDRFIEVTDILQGRYDSMKSENPDLTTADFDAELGTVALEIADEIGARLSVKDSRYIFDFTTEPAPLVKLPEPSEDSFKDEDFEDVF